MTSLPDPVEIDDQEFAFLRGLFGDGGYARLPWPTASNIAFVRGLIDREILEYHEGYHPTSAGADLGIRFTEHGWMHYRLMIKATAEGQVTSKIDNCEE